MTKILQTNHCSGTPSVIKLDFCHHPANKLFDPAIHVIACTQSQIIKSSFQRRHIELNTMSSSRSHQQSANEPVWIARDLAKCSGCRKCEIACSIHHENRIWPEASRVRVFMLVPGADFPHLCAQCENYPCVQACPFQALSVNRKTSAVAIDREKCTGCGTCIDACPGRIPHLHPAEKKIVICDLCDGDPECVKVCQEGEWGVLKSVPRRGQPTSLYARTPEETSRNLAAKMYGEKAEEFF